jgi:hypothetical protein
MKEGIFNQKIDKKNNSKTCINVLKNIISQTKIYNPLIIGKQSTSVQQQLPASRVSVLR